MVKYCKLSKMSYLKFIFTISTFLEVSNRNGRAQLYITKLFIVTFKLLLKYIVWSVSFGKSDRL